LFPSTTANAQPDLSIVIVSYNTERLLRRVLRALQAGQGKLKLQVIVIDNASSDGSVELLESEFPNVELLKNKINQGFGRANNLALPLVRGRHVLFLNTDAFVSSDTLPKTVEFLDVNKKCGVLGAKLIGEDGALKSCCCYFPTPWNVGLKMTGLDRFFPNTRFVDDMSWDHASLRACDWVPGCFYMVRREVIETVGLFDPRYFLYCEEIDHCRSVKKAGWDVIYYPYTQIVHLGGESAEAFDGTIDHNRQVPALLIESWLLYLRKHYGLRSTLAMALLTIAVDLSAALKRAILRDFKQSQKRILHAQLVFRLLSKTRLALRPTR
jgi:N-acetylglucosaminyl-diphospho-decaprenol L-rhamnosyltransferase